jgi:lactoylglutathione lyase
MCNIFSKSFLLASIQILLFKFSATACQPATNPSSPFEFGPEEYPDKETVGININHVALNVGNLTASIEFYTKILGVRVIFVYHATPLFEIAYLGHVSGGHNGTGYQTPLEMNLQKNNMKGLVEFVYIAPNMTEPPREAPVASTRKTNTLSHIGIIVPNIMETQQRCKNAGMKIVKEVDVQPELLGGASNAYGLGLLPPGSDEIAAQVIAGLALSGTANYLFIEDPDGNLLEIEPQY